MRESLVVRAGNEQGRSEEYSATALFEVTANVCSKRFACLANSRPEWK